MITHEHLAIQCRPSKMYKHTLLDATTFVTRVHVASVKHVYVMIATHVRMISLEEKQHSLCMTNNNP